MRSLLDQADPLDDQAWSVAGALWSLRPGVTYLNHGSFGPAPRSVIETRECWSRELEAEPMDFFTRRLEPALAEARSDLADRIGASGDDLIFVENATAGMNLVAHSFPLGPGDEVLLNDHEYGAVRRIWERRTAQCGARSVVQPLGTHWQSADDWLARLLAGITPRTRLIVVSHVTSPTAAVWPIELLCREARARGIAVCVDGPHAVAMLDLRLAQWGCDFYTASCHKWLSAPFGSGFLYVHPQWQGSIQPLVTSWGRSYPPGLAPAWHNEFTWSGTRDPAAYLSIGAAWQVLDQVGLDNFRRRAGGLVALARRELHERCGLEPLVTDDPAWTGTMVAFELPTKLGDGQTLHNGLWEGFQIEIPILEFAGRRWLRVSCHLYNTTADIERLVRALSGLLR